MGDSSVFEQVFYVLARRTWGAADGGLEGLLGIMDESERRAAKQWVDGLDGLKRVEECGGDREEGRCG